jgi:pectate lyase
VGGTRANYCLRPPGIARTLSPVSFGRLKSVLAFFQRFSRGKWMFLPSLARALAYVLSIGFLIGTAKASAPGADPGREPLPSNDGWASVPTAALPQGTTGGSSAVAGRTVTVTNRRELVAALAWPDATPKLIYVKGTIDANVDEAGNPLSCRDYYRADPATGEMYSPFAFMAMYDPAGPLEKARQDPIGGQEDARAASHAAQEARVHLRVPANTTIFGLGSDATISGAWLDITPDIASGNQPMNVIVRNLSFEDTADCFPLWSPSDGVTGNWNASYDSISIRNSTHVWIDHNRFADLHTRDESQPTYFGHRFQVHDDQLDLTHESDYVTVSWNQFTSHDKTMLIGDADGATSDRDKLRVTLHHNLFDNLGQRTPRVRFGRVHVYDNLYRANSSTNYSSSWGIGVESRLYAENNYFEFSTSFNPMEVIDVKKGMALTAIGNCWTEKAACESTDFIAVWNAKFDPDLKTDAGWTPTLYGEAPGAEPPDFARQRILSESGPGGASKKK